MDEARRGENAIRLVVGLGNPGEEYKGTRHNAGFAFVDAFISSLPSKPSIFEASMAEARSARLAGRMIYILKPMTYMNLSGEAVAKFARAREIPPEEIIAVHDDLDLPLGKMKLAVGGGSAGHNGVESMTRCLGSGAFARLKLGIGSEAGRGRGQVDYVLSPFLSEEAEQFREILGRAVEALSLALHRGMAAAMNKCNARTPDKTAQTNNKEK